MVHTCNPSYSGGRDQEDRGSKPARANSSHETLSRKTQHKKGLLEWLTGLALRLNPSPTKKKKKKECGGGG
jgi:hypothetical protein